jgi:hypothetical protein
MRQVTAAFAEYEKANCAVGASRSARGPARRSVGGSRTRSCGQRSLRRPSGLRRASPKTGKRLSFREISDRLEDARHLNESGQPFNQSVRAMIEGSQPRPQREKG